MEIDPYFHQAHTRSRKNHTVIDYASGAITLMLCTLFYVLLTCVD